MDGNEMPISSVEYGGLTFPYGMDPILSLNTEIAGRDRVLTENEREHIIMKCRDAASAEAVKKILEEEVPGESMQGLLDRDKMQ